jgi:importin subunit beta-1
MVDICDVTAEASQKDESEVKTQALEVWSSIAEEESLREEKGERHGDFTCTALNMLLDMIKENIQDLNIGNEDFDEDQEWGTSVAAGCCLNLVSHVARDLVIEPITNFVAEKIQSKDWRHRYCGIIALGAILEGPNKENLQKILQPAVNLFLNLMEDSHPRVRYAVCWLFSRVAKTNAELITGEYEFPILLDKIFKGLKEDVKVAANIGSIIAELAEATLFDESHKETSIFSRDFKAL